MNFSEFAVIRCTGPAPHQSDASHNESMHGAVPVLRVHLGSGHHATRRYIGATFRGAITPPPPRRPASRARFQKVCVLNPRLGRIQRAAGSRLCPAGNGLCLCGAAGTQMDVGCLPWVGKHAPHTSGRVYVFVRACEKYTNKYIYIHLYIYILSTYTHTYGYI